MAKKKSTALAQLRPKYALPATWPQIVRPDYYSWRMASMPADAIVADWSKHHPHNSYSPPFWYADTVVQCKACARKFLFSKEEQRHWYEELKLPIYASAVRCPECRARVRAAKKSQREHMAEVATRAPHPNEAFFKASRPVL